MRKVNYTIIVPTDTDIESVIIKIKRKDNERDRNVKCGKFVLNKSIDDQEPDEGLLFDELY